MPVQKVQSHYQLASVYGVLLAPEPGEVSSLLARVRRIGVHRVESVMDPCCGPATWLRPLAERGIRVAGTDLEPAMVRETRRRLRGFDAEITRGDMRDLAFESGPFDLVINFESSLGHLDSDAAAAKHFKVVAANLAPQGAFLLEVTILDPMADLDTVVELDASPFMRVPGDGEWSVRYQSLGRRPEERVETMEAELIQRIDGQLRRPVVHRYALRTFTSAVLEELAEAAGLRVVGAWTKHGDAELQEAVGDVTVAFRHA